jgi:type IV secretory pathway component VirB8
MNNDSLEEKNVLNQKNDKDKEIDMSKNAHLTSKQEVLLNRFTIAFLVLLTLACLVVVLYFIEKF